MLGPGASQSDVYQAAVKPVVEDVLNGWVGSLSSSAGAGLLSVVLLLQCNCASL